MTKYKKVIVGSARSIHGSEVLIDLFKNGLITYKFPKQEEEGTNKAAWELYCKYVRITIEEISVDEIREELNKQENL